MKKLRNYSMAIAIMLIFAMMAACGGTAPSGAETTAAAAATTAASAATEAATTAATTTAESTTAAAAGAATTAAQATTAVITTTATPETTPAAGTAEADKFFGGYDPMITITSVKNLGSAGLTFPEGDSLEDNVWTRYYEEVLGIKIDWLWSVNDAEYDQKVNIAITSNDIPDIMRVRNTQMKMMYENDQLLDMTDLLPEYWAPFTEDVITADGGNGLRSATFDGKLSAIPIVGNGLGNAFVLWVRTDWLEKLNLDFPETIEDVLALSEAFTTQDPDGNGLDDSFGIAVHKDLFGVGFACLEGFFNAYGAYHDIWIPRDGQLVYGNVQPEAKAALRVLTELYANGQLDPEFGVKDANKVTEDVGANRFGLMFGQFSNMARINPVKVENPEFEWVPVSVPLDSDIQAKAQLPFGTSRYFVISKAAKNPEAFVKMVNLQLEKSYGESAESTRFNITPDGYGPYSYNVVYFEPAMKNFDAAKAVTYAVETGDTSLLNDEQRNYYDMSMMSLSGDHGNNNWHQLKMFGPKGSLSVMQGYWDSGNYMPNAFYGAPTQTMTEKLSTLQTQTLTDYTAIILGGNLDDFEVYVQNWNLLGGEQMTAEVNEWYATQQ